MALSKDNLINKTGISIRVNLKMYRVRKISINEGYLANKKLNSD